MGNLLSWPTAVPGTIFRAETASCVPSLSVYLKILRSLHFDKLKFKITLNKIVKIEKEGFMLQTVDS